MINGVTLTKLKVVELDQGNVLHCIKKNDLGYQGFGEAYFSKIKPGVIKTWKRHNKMTLNLVVPIGKVRFVIFDDRLQSETKGEFYEVILSEDNYMRLTVNPGLWLAFQGCDDDMSMITNIADIMHDPIESDRKQINEIEYNWN